MEKKVLLKQSLSIPKRLKKSLGAVENMYNLTNSYFMHIGLQKTYQMSHGK